MQDIENDMDVAADIEAVQERASGMQEAINTPRSGSGVAKDDLLDVSGKENHLVRDTSRLVTV